MSNHQPSPIRLKLEEEASQFFRGGGKQKCSKFQAQNVSLLKQQFILCFFCNFSLVQRFILKPSVGSGVYRFVSEKKFWIFFLQRFRGRGSLWLIHAPSLPELIIALIRPRDCFFFSDQWHFWCMYPFPRTKRTLSSGRYITDGCSWDMQVPYI